MSMDRPLTPPSVSRWRSKRVWIPMVVLLGVVAFALGAWRWQGRLPEGVVLATVQRGDLDDAVDGQGEFVSDEQRMITAPVAGRVERFAVSPGTRIDVGQTMVQLAVPALLDERDKARLDLQRTEFSSDQTTGESAKTVEAARLRVREAEISLKTARIERDAMQQLLSQKIISRLQFEQVQARVDQGQAALDGARRMLALEQAGMQRQSRMARDDVELERVRLRQLEMRIEEATVRAPVAGVVKRVAVKLGDSVNEGEPLLEVGPLLPDVVRVLVPQRALDRLTIGLPAVIRMPDQQQVPGRVVGIAPDATNGLVAVRIRPGLIPDRARNGLAVQVKIVLGRVHDAYYVASDLDPPPDGTSARVVWVHAGRTRERRVTGLKRVGPYLVVPAHIGIKPGDSVGLVPDDGGGQP